MDDTIFPSGRKNRLKYGMVDFRTCFTIAAVMMRKLDGSSSREGLKAIVGPEELQEIHN